MRYPYNSHLYLKEVALNVLNLEKQTQFYTDALGLQIVHQSESETALGVGTTCLVRLIKTNQPQALNYGLYHFALLLPERKALATLLRHLVSSNIPLSGGSDHGYSEAIYLSDPEGNGIELYADKDWAAWDIREDGRIIGVTEALDFMALYHLGDANSAYTMPQNTRMGHIHLSVQNSQQSSATYQQLLQIDDKFSVPSASWLASGMYHHHLAVNHWAGNALSKRNKQDPGLNYFALEVASKTVLEHVRHNAEQLSLSYSAPTENSLEVTDFDGITLLLTASSHA